MVRHQLLFTFCVCLLSLSLVAQENNLRFEREYKAGDKYRYQLTTEYYQNHQWKARTISICELTVQTDSAGIPYESLQWLSQQSITATDTTDESSMARRVTPYHISLHPKGSLQLPVITEAGMTGAITDFNTFYVAIDGKAGVNMLHKAGDQYVSPSPVKGNFGNGKTILKGEDCINISSRLLEINAVQAVIQTSFLPPAQACLDYYLPAFSKPVSGDTLNNIQMIMAVGNGKVNLQFGNEKFVITSHINITDGKLATAEMTNELILRLKVNCSSSLEDCQMEMPWHIYRTLSLKLLP